ncbi:hypothetical protein BDV96DRAFT_75407 [Lophiotrema nucula]|uniref:2EXR domain-containing protein n=1 Tax=Lophiotrema nucula TaxID=690887 RepID=A0A6A5Z7F0_9PLEO|nr:hypothetical protein BDV96DRAFT_75407 [Lophiotrema nucula]
MDSPFLRLPGELRNRIYELVLFTPDNTLHFKLHISRSKGKAPKTVAVLCTTAKKDVDSEDPLQNYKYDFNQLKNTCHEIRDETEGLELKYNVLEFDQQVEKNPKPGRQFLWFIKSYPHFNLALLHSVVLSSTLADKSPHVREPFLPEPTDILLALADFCDSNPHVEVTYMLPPIAATRDRRYVELTDYHVLDLMDYGIFYTWLLFGTDLRYLYPKDHNGWWPGERLRGLIGRNEMHRKPNSRFVDEGIETQEGNLVFRIRDGVVREKLFECLVNAPYWNGVRKEEDCRFEWLLWARRWVNEGI